MKSRLDLLQPYPFERLRVLLNGIQANKDYSEIRLSIGEPQHPTPPLIGNALTSALSGLANYPTTLGIPLLRQTISAWLMRRYGLASVNPETEILPVNGSREALFSFAQAIVGTAECDRRIEAPLVACPNPFYQIYEGAALLAGAQPVFLNTLPENDYALGLTSLDDSEWKRVQLLYVCSPGNPTGKVLSLDDWRNLFALADQYGFVIASDECYSEIYFDEAQLPLGALQAAEQLGRERERLVVFSSLSKRSNAPGLRSGFVAGDAELIRKFFLYRTYHGCAMSLPVQMASIAAWQDEAHVIDNRRQYAEKFSVLTPLLNRTLPVPKPDAGFYFWLRTPIADTEFARALYAQYNVLVLPGSYLARTARDINPGEDFIRIALVAPLAECRDAVERIIEFTEDL